MNKILLILTLLSACSSDTKHVEDWATREERMFRPSCTKMEADYYKHYTYLTWDPEENKCLLFARRWEKCTLEEIHSLAMKQCNAAVCWIIAQGGEPNAISATFQCIQARR